MPPLTKPGQGRTPGSERIDALVSFACFTLLFAIIIAAAAV
jgi:hypothetical protein